MKSGIYIVIVIGLALATIVALFIFAPANASAQTVSIIAFAGMAVALLAKQGETEAKVDTAKEISQKNAETLTEVAEKVSTNTAITETTHQIVNSQRSEMLGLIDDLRGEVNRLKQEKAATATAQSHADDTEARIISAIGAAATKPPDT